MDEEVRDSITDKLGAAGPEYPQCPDCGNPFAPGHHCRESMEFEVVCQRAAFQISLVTLGKVKNKTKVYRRGDETALIKEIYLMTTKAFSDIEELLYKPKEKVDELNGVDNRKPGCVPYIPPDSL